MVLRIIWYKRYKFLLSLYVTWELVGLHCSALVYTPLACVYELISPYNVTVCSGTVANVRPPLKPIGRLVLHSPGHLRGRVSPLELYKVCVCVCERGREGEGKGGKNRVGVLCTQGIANYLDTLHGCNRHSTLAWLKIYKQCMGVSVKIKEGLFAWCRQSTQSTIWLLFWPNFPY